MIKTIKSHAKKKNYLLSFLVLISILSYNLFLMVDRQIASKIDIETESLNKEVRTVIEQSKNITELIKTIERRYKEYLLKIEGSRNLTIDAVVLNREISEFIGLVNQYYDNSMFVVRLGTVKQSDEYLNIGNIVFSFEFRHNYSNNPELAKEIEDAILRNVFYDFTKNFSKVLSVLDEKSFVNLEEKIINISYLKEK